jgi:DNA-binding transcriptional ArsR family regulator
MVSLTENEAKAIDFLIRNFSEEYNINQLSRELKLSPRGIFKILKKLEEQRYLISKRQGNNIFYQINYSSQEALDACKFVLSERKITPFIKIQLNDLENLKGLAQIAILFGSILTKDKDANDVDVILIFKQRDFSKIQQALDKINSIKHKKFHAIYQTQEDLVNNIKKKDKVVLSAIKTGIILWGRDLFLEAIKDGKD